MVMFGEKKFSLSDNFFNFVNRRNHVWSSLEVDYNAGQN